MREFNVGAKICGSRSLSWLIVGTIQMQNNVGTDQRDVFAFLCDIVTQGVKRSAFAAREQPTRFAHIDWALRSFRAATDRPGPFDCGRGAPLERCQLEPRKHYPQLRYMRLHRQLPRP